MNLIFPIVNNAVWRSGLFVSVISICAISALGNEVSTPSEIATVDRSTETLSGVSVHFLQRVDQAKDSIPDTIWTELHQAGWRLQVVEFVVDASPALKNTRPRNWPEGATWENTDALHLPNSRRLVIAEKRKSRAGMIVDNSRVGGTLRHEVGHAFDMATGVDTPFHSASPEFMVAYQRDTSRIAKDDQAVLNYYLTYNAAGPQESFAEAFAVVLGGGSDQANRGQFVRSFPAVVQHVREMIDAFEPSPAVIEPNTTQSGATASPNRRLRNVFARHR